VLRALVALAIALTVLYLAGLAMLLVMRPRGAALRESVRLLPDLLRLVRRLGSDTALPRSLRVRLWALLGYLAMPVDLVPDIIPVLGYADDAIAIAIVLRSVVRRAGPDALERHWPGTPAGLDAVRRLCGISPARPAAPAAAAPTWTR
jgi:uncharacterized membrane protein YkvA (DUF1232 family)